MKEAHAGADTRWEDGEVVCRVEMLRASKGERDGMESALRFCIIGSSMLAREIRRKSGEKGQISYGLWTMDGEEKGAARLATSKSVW